MEEATLIDVLKLTFSQINVVLTSYWGIHHARIHDNDCYEIVGDAGKGTVYC